MADIRQTSQWAKYMNDSGWRVIKLNDNYLYIRKLPLIGSYIKIPRPGWPLNFKKIDAIARQNHALLIKITPKIESDSAKAPSIHNQLIKHGFTKEYWTPTVTKTLIIDLTKSEESIFRSFSKKTRQYINLAKKQEVKIISSRDIRLCYKLYLETAKRNKFTPQSFDEINLRYQAFKENSLLLFALSPHSEPVATLLILFNPSEKKAFCSVAGTADIHRNLKASYLLHWQVMLKTKKLGYKLFDFDGIYDPQNPQTKNWQGFTFFKKGFGGKEVTYIGSYLKWYNPLLRFLFKLLTKITN